MGCPPLADIDRIRVPGEVLQEAVDARKQRGISLWPELPEIRGDLGGRHGARDGTVAAGAR